MKLSPFLLVLACALFPFTSAHAQTATKPAPAKPAAKPPAKPAPKPAAKPAVAAQEKTATLGGGNVGSAAALPILSREELRACLNQEETVRTRLAEHQERRAPIDEARQGIGAQQEALRNERAQVDAVAARVQAFRAKMESHSARVAKWNADAQAFNSQPPAGSVGERERQRINTERTALQAAQTELETERKTMTEENEKIVAAYNAKVKEVEAAVAAWNQRNLAWNEAGQKLEDERKGWVGACADRRYREEDENAIRAGK